MSRIRGTKSGLLPQRLNWEISHLDFAFLWAWIGILFFSPIIEWGIIKISGAFSFFYWVGEFRGRLLVLVFNFNLAKAHSILTRTALQIQIAPDGFGSHPTFHKYWNGATGKYQTESI